LSAWKISLDLKTVFGIEEVSMRQPISAGVAAVILMLGPLPLAEAAR
jgi:hypothetical protein